MAAFAPAALTGHLTTPAPLRPARPVATLCLSRRAAPAPARTLAVRPAAFYSAASSAAATAPRASPAAPVRRTPPRAFRSAFCPPASISRQSPASTSTSTSPSSSPSPSSPSSPSPSPSPRDAAAMPSWFTRVAGYPRTVVARADTGTTPAEAEAAATARASYAVADGSNLDLLATPPRRIALLVEPSPFTHTSGYSNRFKNLLLQLQQAGDHVLVIVPDNSPDAPTEFAGAKIINVPGFRFPLYRRITLTLGLRGVYNALKDFNPDVMHLTTPGFLVFSTLLFARLLCKPLLLSYHTHLPIYTKDYGLGLLQGLTWTMLRLQHNRADFTLTTSPQLCEELVQNGFERVGLWRKGIDTTIFNPRYKSHDMRVRLSQGHPEDPLLIYVGRIGAEKNLIFFKDLMQRFPDARLALVGDGPYKTVLEQELADTKTVFTGILHGEQLSQAFASADIFVMPSESETLGFVVLESMASGVPVVGARAGGIPDIIDDGRTGFLFSPSSYEECTGCIETLLKDTKKRTMMGAAARAEALRWSWRASAAATRNVGYGRAISNFKYRAMGGLGLPRSLTWLRWLRRRIVMLRLVVSQRLFGRLNWGINAN